jgi:hypothetical protein
LAFYAKQSRMIGQGDVGANAVMDALFGSQMGRWNAKTGALMEFAAGLF